MKQGTVSVLIGTHSLIHSLLVYISWVKIHHRLPKPWETVCILIHDLGHWGKDYLDKEKLKRQHWVLGAEIAEELFGKKGFLLIAGHDRHSGYPESDLLKPDKYSWYIAPFWWLWFNNLVEPGTRQGTSNTESVRYFQAWVKENIESGKYGSTHDAYSERRNLKWKPKP